MEQVTKPERERERNPEELEEPREAAGLQWLSGFCSATTKWTLPLYFPKTYFLGSKIINRS